jgi:hypothetical protein
MKNYRIEYINKPTGEWRHVIFRGINPKMALSFFTSIYGYRDIINVIEL